LIKTIENELEVIYLYPAAMEVPLEPKRVHTILGSCIAVCLFDKVKKRGGINHYMLPYWSGSGLATPKYGNIAIEKLIAQMVANGSNKSHLVAKVFGGAAVLETSLPSFNIGEKNIKVALDMLASNKIPVVAQSTGGKKGRKILFNSYTSEVAHRFIKSEES
jgi:chemotaxis protein CheD